MLNRYYEADNCKKDIERFCNMVCGDKRIQKSKITCVAKNVLFLKKFFYFYVDNNQTHYYSCLITMEELASKPLFVSAKKPYSRMTVAGVQYLVKNLGKKAGVGNVHPHRFRRTFATDLLNRGMRIEEVMVLMGHTKIETTLIYCNIKQDNVRESYRKYAA